MQPTAMFLHGMGTKETAHVDSTLRRIKAETKIAFLDPLYGDIFEDTPVWLWAMPEAEEPDPEVRELELAAAFVEGYYAGWFRDRSTAAELEVQGDQVRRGVDFTRSLIVHAARFVAGPNIRRMVLDRL